jgi:hypothetical protein
VEPNRLVAVLLRNISPRWENAQHTPQKQQFSVAGRITTVLQDWIPLRHHLSVCPMVLLCFRQWYLPWRRNGKKKLRTKGKQPKPNADPFFGQSCLNFWYFTC